MQEISTKSSELLKKIEEMLKKIQSRRPLNTGEKTALHKALVVEFTYNSNAIEGNTLTRSETKIILEDGITIGGKSIRELDEAKNHKKCFEFLQAFLVQKKEIDEQAVLDLHKLILTSIDDENAGKYRAIQVYISGDAALPPKASQLPQKMKEFFTWYNTSKKTLHPALLAIEFHYRLVKIHPFIDGNGRLVRLLLNLILMQNNYPMIIVPVVRRQEYISSLHSSSSLQNFQDYMLDIILINLQDYWRMIEE